MSASEPEITYRTALLSDYDGVMALGSIYGGRDYLWSLYKQLITDPDKYGIVAVVDDTIVGFYMTSTFDGGRTVLKRSGRVSEQFRGRGIFHRLEAELDKHTLQHRPRAMYDTFANTEREEHLGGKFLEMGFKEVYRKGMFHMIFKFSNLPPLGLNGGDNKQMKNATELTRDDVKLIFRTEDVSRQLFPSQRLLNCYMCYRLVDDNIPYMFCERGGAVCTLQDFQYSSSSSSSQKLDNDSVRHIAMVTFYYCYPTPTGFLYYLDAYAVKGVSRDHFHAHLKKNLEILQHYFPKQDGVVTVAYDGNVPMEHVASCLEDAGMTEHMKDQERVQILYERDRAACGFPVEK
ncbi:histidine n-acetyltransferase-like [Plakobranchus ocellatus]|uniref:Histidine n-acetyltransferase-like n=1 Tax=Plakobranchus ocellatus TaxID=259542 RepID=A0AAV4DP50_9GAST|nr:histidine n-acetyltransferase-like [Plakobranchus ocellatus]